MMIQSATKDFDRESICLGIIGTIFYISGRRGNDEATKIRDMKKKELDALIKKEWADDDRSRAKGIS